MNYIQVLRLMARHPMYLLSPYYPPQATDLDTLIASRNNYIDIVEERMREWSEYDECIKKAEDSEDREEIDLLICEHLDRSFASHSTHKQNIFNSWYDAHNQIDKLGKKIERRMRKKLGI